MVLIKKNENGGFGNKWILSFEKKEFKNNFCNCCGEKLLEGEIIFMCEFCQDRNLNPLFHKKCLKEYGGSYDFPCDHMPFKYDITYYLGKIEVIKPKKELLEE